MTTDKFKAIEIIRDLDSDDSVSSPPVPESNTSKEVNCSLDDTDGGGFQTHEIEHEWWLVGCTEVIGFSTCKGRRLKRGDAITFSFPIPRSASNKQWGRGRAAAACSEIVRFSTKQYGEVGRLPSEWTRCLIPLVNLKKVKIQGCCVAAPETLGLMDSILLSVRLYINNSILQSSTGLPPKFVDSSTEDSAINPLPTLLRLLGKKPSQKDDFTPEDLYTRKRSLGLKDNLGVSMPLLPAPKRCKSTTGSNVQENEGEEDIPDSELNKLVGSSESFHLEVEATFKLLGQLISQNLLPAFSVPQDFWDLRVFSEVPSGTSLYFIASFFSGSGCQVDFVLGSWLHCRLTFGALNIATIIGMVFHQTDTPHLLIEFIQSSPTSLVLVLNLLQRKDLVLEPEYLQWFYEDTKLDVPIQNL